MACRSALFFVFVSAYSFSCLSAETGKSSSTTPPARWVAVLNTKAIGVARQETEKLEPGKRLGLSMDEGFNSIRCFATKDFAQSAAGLHPGVRYRF